MRVNHIFIHPSQYNTIWFLNCIEKTPKFFCSLHYRQSKNPAKASVNPFIIEEAVAGTSTVAPLKDIDIDINNLIDDIDPIGAVFNPQTPNTVEVPTYIVCNPNRSPKDKSIKDMKNKEDGFDDGYDSNGEMGPFYIRTNKEGPQLFNDDDNDDVGFVTIRLIDDDNERDIDTDVVIEGELQGV